MLAKSGNMFEYAKLANTPLIIFCIISGSCLKLFASFLHFWKQIKLFLHWLFWMLSQNLLWIFNTKSPCWFSFCDMLEWNLLLCFEIACAIVCCFLKCSITYFSFCFATVLCNFHCLSLLKTCHDVYYGLLHAPCCMTCSMHHFTISLCNLIFVHIHMYIHHVIHLSFAFSSCCADSCTIRFE